MTGISWRFLQRRPASLWALVLLAILATMTTAVLMRIGDNAVKERGSASAAQQKSVKTPESTTDFAPRPPATTNEAPQPEVFSPAPTTPRTGPNGSTSSPSPSTGSGNNSGTQTEPSVPSDGGSTGPLLVPEDAQTPQTPSGETAPPPADATTPPASDVGTTEGNDFGPSESQPRGCGGDNSDLICSLG